MRAALTIAGAVAVLCLAGPTRAAPTVDGLLKQLETASSSMTGLSGDFTQTNILKMFKRPIETKGHFYFQRPRRIRWEYSKPDPSTLILDGDTATLRTPGATPRVFDLAKDAVMRTVFDQLLLWVGSSSLDQAKGNYAIAASGTDQAPTLTLTPNPGGPISKAFARIELSLDDKLLLRTILLVEPTGDEKKIMFNHMVRNPKLPADAFKP